MSIFVQIKIAYYGICVFVQGFTHALRCVNTANILMMAVSVSVWVGSYRNYSLTFALMIVYRHIIPERKRKMKKKHLRYFSNLKIS